MNAKNPDYNPFLNSRGYWTINIPRSLQDHYQQKRKQFPSKDLAENFAKDIRSQMYVRDRHTLEETLKLIDAACTLSLKRRGLFVRTEEYGR